MQIETERLIIDDIRPEDRDNYFINISHDKEVLKTFVCRYQENLEDFDFDQYLGRSDLFAIREKNSKSLIGIFVECDVDREKKTLEIGYGLGNKHWHKGYMTETVKAMLDYYVKAGFQTVYASFFPENLASKRIMEKCGMTYSHTKEKEFEYLGQERDLIYYKTDTSRKDQQTPEGPKKESTAAGSEDNAEAIVDTALAGEIEMSYLRFGSGSKTLVILPGLSIKPVTLSAQAVVQGFADFTQDYTIYLFDRRTNMPDRYSIDQMAEDTAAIMRALGIENADIFGTSQGGMIAMNIAIKYPELVNKMVLGSTAVRTNETMKSVLSDWISLAEAKDGYELNKVVSKAIYSDTVYEAYKDILLPAGNEISETELNRFIVLASSITTLELYDDLDKITCKVLVLGSEGDQVTTADASREIAEKLGCESYFYDDSYGHAVYDEAPDYRGRVLEFLKQ